MKNFFALLLKGIGIALAVSLAICFFAWYWGNWRAIIWYALGVMFVWQTWKYFKTPLWNYKNASVKLANSPWRKIRGFIIGISCTFVILLGMYEIGRLGEFVLGFSCSYFELTTLIGFILILLCVEVYFMVGLMYCAFQDYHLSRLKMR